MADERNEVLKFSQWKGWTPYNWPPTVRAKRVSPDTLIAAGSLDYAPDGALVWSRDQFRIKQPASDAVSLYEYLADSTNQLVAFCEDGNMYTMNTDWANASSSIWDYGYQLFSSGTWTNRGAVGVTTGIWAIEQYNGELLFNDGVNGMKRWDGTTLEAVGIATPEGGVLYTVSDMEYLLPSVYDDWEETDTGSYLTVSAASVAAAALLGSAASYLRKDITGGGTTDFAHRFEFSVTSATAGGQYAVWAVSSEPAFSYANYPIRLGFERVGAKYYLQLSAGYVEDTTYEISLATTYYCTVGRVGNTVTFNVYSDSGRTAVLYSHMLTEANEVSYAYLASSYGGASVATFTVGNVYLDGAIDGSGQMVAGNYGYYYTWVKKVGDVILYESMPSDKVVFAVGTDSSVTLNGLLTGPVGTTNRYVYRGYAASGAPADYGFLRDIGDNTTTSFTDDAALTDVGETIAFDHAIAPKMDLMCLHNERMYGARATSTSSSYTAGNAYDPLAPYTANLSNILFYSELGEPYYYPALNQITIGDDAPIVALASWRKHLIIFKTNSVWGLTGYDNDDFVLEKIEDIGAAAYGACASSALGFMWAAPHGLMFFDGSAASLLFPFGQNGAFSRPNFSDGEYPKMAYHDGRYCYLTGTRMVWWDAVRNAWGVEEQGWAGSSAGIRSFVLGDKQSHILCTKPWVSSTVYSLTDEEITVQNTGRAFTGYATAGSLYSDYFAPLSIVLPPLIGETNEEIRVLEIWVEGSWDLHATLTKNLQFYINNSGVLTSGLVGALPQGNRAFKAPEASVGTPVYVIMTAEYAPNLRIDSISLVVSRRKRHATA